MNDLERVRVDKFGREAADGAPHGAERTARRRRIAALRHWAILNLGLAGVSTVGQGPRRTHAAGVGLWGGADRPRPNLRRGVW